MRPVRPHDEKRAKRVGGRCGAVVPAVTALASTACGGAADPVATADASPEAEAGPEVWPAPGRPMRRSSAARALAAKRRRLAEVPLLPPAPPARKPVLRTRDGFEVLGHGEDGLPPVFTTVPTRHKVVFLTIDDGAEKDPAFLRMSTSPPADGASTYPAPLRRSPCPSRSEGRGVHGGTRMKLVTARGYAVARPEDSL